MGYSFAKINALKWKMDMTKITIVSMFKIEMAQQYDQCKEILNEERLDFGQLLQN